MPVIVLRVLGGRFFLRNFGNSYDTSDTKKEAKKEKRKLDKWQIKGEGEQWSEPCGGWFSMLAAVQ